MKITHHYPSSVETITIDEKEDTVIVENQCYSLAGRKTKTYIKRYSINGVPADIWIKIKKEELRLEEENEPAKKV